MVQESSLIAEAVQGNQEAFANIRSRYRGVVRGEVVRWAGSFEGEDLEQEVWMKVWTHLSRFQVDKPLAPWLQVVARNHCTDWWRKRQRRGTTVSLEDREVHQQVAPSGDPAHRSAVVQALADLPPEERRLLTLRYFEGCSCEQIARLQGRSVGAVKVALHRARTSLRDVLKKIGQM